MASCRVPLIDVLGWLLAVAYAAGAVAWFRWLRAGLRAPRRGFPYEP